MKSQRLLEVLLRLQARSPRTAPELAQTLGVTPRTILRDVATLEAAGVPIFTTRGVRGGIGLVDGYRQAIAQLADDEIRALFVGGADPLADLGLGDRLEPAREKLFGALSPRQRRSAIEARSRIRIEQRPWAQGPQPLDTLAKLRQAIWDDRAIRVAYRDQTGRRSARSLEPLGIVIKAGASYLVAREGLRTLTFRVERLLEIELENRRFERPTDFDLDRYWQASARRYESRAEPFSVRLEGKKADLERLAGLWPTQLEPDVPSRKTSVAQVTFSLRGQAIH